MLLGGPHYVLLMDNARKRALSLLLNEILISYSFNPGKLYWDGNHKSCHFVFVPLEIWLTFPGFVPQVPK